MKPWATHWHISCSTLGDTKRLQRLWKSPSKSGGEHGTTRTYRGFRSTKIYQLIPHARPGSEVAAFHCRHRADHRQFLGLPGVSRYPPLPAVFRERQIRRDGRSLGFKLGRFQRRNLAHRAAGLRMVKRVMDAYSRGQQWKKSGIDKILGPTAQTPYARGNRPVNFSGLTSGVFLRMQASLVRKAHHPSFPGKRASRRL